MADTTYTITATLENCKADKDNVSSFETTATLKYLADEGFPFDGFTVVADGATADTTLSADKKTATIVLSSPTKNVTLTVSATISSGDLNDEYLVKDGKMYRNFDKRNLCEWDPRWYTPTN